MRELSQVEPMPTVVVTCSWPVGPSWLSDICVSTCCSSVMHAVGGAEQLLAHFGEHEPARVADEELEAKIFLQRRNLPRDGRLAHVQLLGRVGEAPRFRGGVEDAELVPIHRACHLFGRFGEVLPGGRNRSASSAAMQPCRRR